MKDKNNSLALLGGEPVRIRPFFNSVVIDESEWNYAKEVFERKEFSRFIGSPSPDIEEVLVMPSEEAENLEGQYFSFLGGRFVRKFEARFAKKFKVKYAISVNSATSGLSAALGAANIGPGDEVITTCLSFNATAMSILSVNAIPVFVDVDDKTFCVDPNKIEKAITGNTKAILVVHLLGNAADMDRIMEIGKKHKLIVIEDAAQAPGTMYGDKYVGTVGDIGIFSLQETKNIMTGEGGMVVTENPYYAKKIRMIRNHGESIPDNTWSEDDLVNLVGLNYRMTELTAAIGLAQLEKLEDNNRIRKENAKFLKEGLSDIPGIYIPKRKKGEVPHIFAMLYDHNIIGVERYRILAALRAEGIPVGSGYLRLMYENPVFLKKIAYGRKGCPWSCYLYGTNRDYHIGDCPVGEKLIRERFIWFYHINRPNSKEDMEDVVKAFKKVFNNLETIKKIDINYAIPYKW